MLSPYRRVLGFPGALAFSISGLFARLPISMVSLGIVLLVSTRTGSYALAGTVSAAYLVANAVFAVVQGRVTDRLGQSRVLPWTILVFAVSLAMMMWAVEAGWRTPLPHVFAALSGAALPQVGSCVRARWSRLVIDKRELQTAFAFEAVVDEAVFMLGPTLVTFLATGVHPLAGLVAAVVAGVAGTLALSAQRGTEPPAHRSSHTGTGPRPGMGWLVLGPLVAASFMIGTLFGGVEVAAVAFSEELGSKVVAGVLLATYALGSLLSGLIYGGIHWKSSNGSRFRWGVVALAVSMTPLPFINSFWVMGLVLLVAGFAISPTLIASVAWVEETVPVNRLTEGISIMSTGLAAGVAPGAALSGIVIDRYGASPSFWVPVTAGVAGAVIAVGTLLLPRPAAPSPTGSSVSLPDRRSG